ncbi:MAG: C4-type zinc ribbon domain-containing protein [Candidatus Omnitrophica bacterium]|nr:C4-type zinc ribbon domain-containing protein [Candidatus Omnitrophota bacterium]
MAVDDQIRLLIDLQKLDSQIYKLRKELVNQPALINNLEENFKQKEATLKKKEEELKSLSIKRKEKELELDTKEAGIKKLQIQLYQIKTNKEYQAMENEIASQKADVSVLEEDIIKILDEIDGCTEEIARQMAILNQERQRFNEEKNRIDARTREIEASLQGLYSERASLTQKIEKEFLEKYERILRSKDGVAMVEVRGDACGGCNINLPPQVINEIRLKQELIFCGSCARILYIEEGQDNKVENQDS